MVGNCSMETESHFPNVSNIAGTPHQENGIIPRAPWLTQVIKPTSITLNLKTDLIINLYSFLNFLELDIWVFYVCTPWAGGLPPPRPPAWARPIEKHAHRKARPSLITPLAQNTVGTVQCHKRCWETKTRIFRLSFVSHTKWEHSLQEYTWWTTITSNKKSVLHPPYPSLPRWRHEEKVKSAQHVNLHWILLCSVSLAVSPLLTRGSWKNDSGQHVLENSCHWNSTEATFPGHVAAFSGVFCLF